MVGSANPDEVALIIAEDKPDVRSAMRDMLKFAQRPPALLVPFLHDDERPHLPLSRIVDTVHFAGKLDSSPLQVADLCAFAIMRRLKRASGNERLYAPIERNIVFKPSLVS